MASDFDPNLSILEAPQRELWDELREVPEPFVLYGGTALALRLGHRVSVDFDFFSSEQFDSDTLYHQIGFLAGSQTVQKGPNTITCLVDRKGPVKVSFFGVPSISLLQTPSIAQSNGVRVASLLDLAGTKAAVVQKRAEAKDYIDIDTLIAHGGISLSQCLVAAKLIYGAAFNPLNTLKALSFYGDGNLQTLKQSVRDRLAAAVRQVDLDTLPELHLHGEKP